MITLKDGEVNAVQVSGDVSIEIDKGRTTMGHTITVKQGERELVRVFVRNSGEVAIAPDMKNVKRDNAGDNYFIYVAIKE